MSLRDLLIQAVVFVIGYWFGRRTEQGPRQPGGRWLRSCAWCSRVVRWLDKRAGVIVVTVALVVGGLTFVALRDQSQTIGCLTDQLRIRSQALAESDTAQSNLLLGFARLLGSGEDPPEGSPEDRRRDREVRRLLLEFVDEAKRVDEIRARYPLTDC